MKKVLKPFSIEAAKNGAKLSTRQGECIQWWHKLYDGTIIYGINEDFRTTDINGTCHSYRSGSNYDLMIEEDEFEDGDILAAHHGDDLWIIIFKKIDESKDTNSLIYHAMLNSISKIILKSNCLKSDWVLATEEEKKKLFDALAKEGKRWNAEKKVIEDIKEENDYKFQCGDAVLVKDDDDELWIPALFIDYNYDRYRDYQVITTNGRYKMCIDYDSNRELAYKQNNP